MDPVAAAKKQLSSHFGPLVEDMWRGGYKKMRPGSFKTALGERHPQFKGSMQHDCQEFLALLLDTLHDELMAARFGCDMKCPAGGPAPLLFQANSSMEMNAAESSQMDDEDAAAAGSRNIKDGPTAVAEVHSVNSFKSINIFNIFHSSV